MNCYVIDTSSFIDIFHRHPPDLYPVFWEQFNKYIDELLIKGELIILNYVSDEILHDAGTKLGDTEDPIAIWLRDRKKYIKDISTDISILKQVKDILQKFPHSVDTEKTPEAADPYLIAFVLDHQKQQDIMCLKKTFVIVTQESRNKNIDIEEIRERNSPIPEVTKIRSICDYYDIPSMDYLGLFRTEGWTF
ncbi:DUF4411 family protein [Methanocorpusculum sp. MG]|uniref:DUF4411 family protein n=1 Tax=Methanocorpusculum petauri TaxID=3002863 RepID=A0ABT4IEA0_9EURY|nr:DUF4411 family protein [Methanocorpusculum petauri]